jgi:hypothetical protein
MSGLFVVHAPRYGQVLSVSIVLHDAGGTTLSLKKGLRRTGTQRPPAIDGLGLVLGVEDPEVALFLKDTSRLRTKERVKKRWIGATLNGRPRRLEYHLCPCHFTQHCKSPCLDRSRRTFPRGSSPPKTGPALGSQTPQRNPSVPTLCSSSAHARTLSWPKGFLVARPMRSSSAFLHPGSGIQ